MFSHMKLNPFTLTYDNQLYWLRNAFLEYFEAWLASAKQRPGMF